MDFKHHAEIYKKLKLQFQENAGTRTNGSLEGQTAYFIGPFQLPSEGPKIENNTEILLIHIFY